MPPKTSHGAVPTPYAVEAACRALGERIAVARKRRRLTQKDLAKKAGLSAFTIMRVEKGVPSTELGSVVRVLWAMGLDGAVGLLADTSRDEEGEALERARLPMRVSRRKKGGLDDDF